MTDKKYKSGFVTVIGRPNVGKSTLLNDVMGEKLSIISNKPQTTRNKIQLIYTEDDLQVVFLDTPGVQMPKNKLGEYMLKVSKGTLNEVDLITYIVDDSKSIGKLDSYIIDILQDVETPIVLVINKIDKLSDGELRDIIKMYDDMNIFERIVPISALNSDNVNEYIEALKDLLEEGPQYYPDDMITDQPERVIVSEMIREKALNSLEEEVPHGIFVGIDKMTERDDRDLMDIYATIYCEKNSHKGIVIGKNGRMLKRIGQEARKDIEKLLGSQVNLQLWVKVEKNWREKERQIKRFGYQ